MKSLLLAGAALSGAVLPSFAAAQELAAADDAEAAGSAIVVTGTRRGGGRTVADSPVPIDVISPQELQATGRTGLKEVLGNIIPSLTMPALGGGGTRPRSSITFRAYRAVPPRSTSTSSPPTP